MDLSTARVGKVSPAEMQYRLDNGLCKRCGGQGHIAINCTPADRANVPPSRGAPRLGRGAPRGGGQPGRGAPRGGVTGTGYRGRGGYLGGYPNTNPFNNAGRGYAPPQYNAPQYGYPPQQYGSQVRAMGTKTTSTTTTTPSRTPTPRAMSREKYRTRQPLRTTREKRTLPAKSPGEGRRRWADTGNTDRQTRNQRPRATTKQVDPTFHVPDPFLAYSTLR